MSRIGRKLACGVVAVLFAVGGVARAADDDLFEGIDKDWAKKAADAGRKAANNTNADAGKKVAESPAADKASTNADAARKPAASNVDPKPADPARPGAPETTRPADAARPVSAETKQPAAAPATTNADAARKPAATTNADAARTPAATTNVDAARQPAGSTSADAVKKAKKPGEKKRRSKKNGKKAADARKAADAKKAEAAKPAPKPAPAKKPSATKPASKAPATASKPAPAGAVQLSRRASVAANVLGKGEILDQCQIETALPAAIAERNPNVFLTDKPSASGIILTLKIVELRAAGGGILSGPKGLTVDGRLVAGGKLKGTFVARDASMGSVSNCGMLSKVVFELAEDIAGWLDQPAMNSRLGSTR
ncbi:MAG TPA: hypothetical protein VEC57_10680 [Candidatus Limnocylindrales bacterium]|nr:hypothetical protein [Candidatus Limnocylindrales bacterium]